MSGAKRRTKYQKHVTQDFNDSERVPNEGEVCTTSWSKPWW